MAEKGYVKQPSKHIGLAIAFVIALIMAVAVGLYFFQSSVPDIKEQGALSIKNAISDSAMQCFAIEGAYPRNLQYLEDNYGLVVNHDDYSISYEVFADNVAPNITVVAKTN